MTKTYHKQHHKMNTSHMSLSSYILFKGSSVIANFFNAFTTSFFANIIIPFIAFLAPTKEIVVTTICAVGVDFLSGIAKAKKLKQKITSFRLRDTVIKLFFYLCIILIVYGLQVVSLWNIPLTNLVSAFIIFAELISISENVDIITNNHLGIARFVKRIRKNWFKTFDKTIEDSEINENK